MPNREAWTAYGAIAAATLLLMLPALARPMMLHDSFWIDHVWASQFTALLGEGVLYPRWLPWSHEGLGSPVFYYYPPLAFYVSGAFGLTGMSTYDSILATFALAFFVSGIGAWHWLRGRTEYPLVGALFFTLAPYHVVDFYGRGAQAESVAIAVLPWLAIGLRRIAEGKGWAWAAIAYAAIIFSHLPLALLTSVFLIAPYAIVHRRQWTGFAYACFGGIGLAAIYLVPVFGLGAYRDPSSLWASSFMRPTFWSLYAGNWGVPAVAYAHLTIAALAIPALILAFRTRKRPAIYAVAIIVIAFGLIPMLWSLPLLRYVQFPYRMLPLAELGLAAAFASRSSMGIGGRLAIMAVPLAWSVAVIQLPRDPPPDRDAVERRYINVPDYLPPGLKRERSSTHWIERPWDGRLPTRSAEGWIVKPVFYFPAWSCGEAEPRTKLLMHRPGCEPEIRMTVYEKIGGLVSLASFLMVLLGSAMSIRRERRISA